MVDEGFTDADGDGYFLEVDDCDDADPNEHPGQTWYKDADNDSYSDGTTNTVSCTRPAGYKVAGELTATSGDCDDDVAAINPGAAEVFDGIDNNCNGVVDEGFTDADGDGYFLEVDDCDDADPNEHPGQTWYKDADNDSYSDGTTNTVSCTRPAGYKVAGELTATSGDCDDDVAAINPGAAEVFDGIDNNCNWCG